MEGNVNEQPDDITSYDRGVTGWLVDERGEKGVHVASWLIVEKKNTLFCRLVGHLRSSRVGILLVERWMGKVWSRKPLQVRQLDDLTVWFQFAFEKVAREALRQVEDILEDSPFQIVERCMESMGSPTWPILVRMRGVPLHAWNEEVFRLLGSCMGLTVRVDNRTVQKEDLLVGKVQVFLDRFGSLLAMLPLWVEETRIYF